MQFCRFCHEAAQFTFGLTEETGKKAIPGEIVQPGGGIDLEFETDG